MQFSGGFKSLLLKHCHYKSLMLNYDFNCLLLRTYINLVMESVLIIFVAESVPENCFNYDLLLSMRGKR